MFSKLLLKISIKFILTEYPKISLVITNYYRAIFPKLISASKFLKKHRIREPPKFLPGPNYVKTGTNPRALEQISILADFVKAGPDF